MVGGGCGCNGGYSNAGPMYSAPASSGCSSCGNSFGAAPVQNSFQSAQNQFQPVQNQFQPAQQQYQTVQQQQQYQSYQPYQGVQNSVQGMPVSAPIQNRQPCATGSCPTPLGPFGGTSPLNTNSLSPVGDIIPGQVIGDAAATLGGS